jgi:23S rRNA (guanosine2251-2'-O)-methyltransferase
MSNDPHHRSHRGKPRPFAKSRGGPKPRFPHDGTPRTVAPPADLPADDGKTLLFGIHPVEAALANPDRVVNALFLTENAQLRLAAALEGRDYTITRVTPRELDRRLGADTVHQGALLETVPLPELPMNALARRAGGLPLIVLDQVTDPHNVGAILRSAAVFGAAGVVVTRRHSPPLGGVLAKSASGALELVPVARVQNLARALDDLKAAGCTLIGLDGDGDGVLDELALTGTEWPDKPVFVLGAEGKGLRLLTRQTCNRLCRISTDGKLGSLNVSNAAAVALHLAHIARKRRG